MTVLPTEPLAKDISEVMYNVSDSSMFVKWNAFVDSYHGIDFEVISQYAIALFVKPDHTEDLQQVSKWIHLEQEDYNVDPETNMVSYITYKFVMLHYS